MCRTDALALGAIIPESKGKQSEPRWAVPFEAYANFVEENFPSKPLLITEA